MPEIDQKDATLGGGVYAGLAYVPPQERVPRHSDSIAKLATALAAAEQEFGPIVKDTKNPYYNSMYADLSTLIDATRKALSKNGLAIMQFPKLTDQTVTVTTMLTHTSGEWIKDELSLPATGLGKDGRVKFDAQSVGSAITYARRYAYQALLNIAAEADDDGNEAIQRQPAERREPPSKPATPPVNQKPTTGQDNPRPEEKRKPGRPPKAEIPAERPSAPEPAAPAPATSDGSTTVRFPTKEEKQAYIKRLQVYSREVLPKANVTNPADALKAFITNRTGVEDPKNLNTMQWDSLLAELDAANGKGPNEVVATVRAVV